MSALKSQYEGRLSRQERELRDLRGQQERQEQRDEPAEAGPSKVSGLFLTKFVTICIKLVRSTLCPWCSDVLDKYLLKKKKISKIKP